LSSAEAALASSRHARTNPHNSPEEMQLHPEQSTDAIVIHHPAARYFSV
jgi:cobalamin-dependent methionine synthase I